VDDEWRHGNKSRRGAPATCERIFQFWRKSPLKLSAVAKDFIGKSTPWQGFYRQLFYIGEADKSLLLYRLQTYLPNGLKV